MRFRLAYEKGGSQPRVCVWDESGGDDLEGQWVNLHQALSRRDSFDDPELEVAICAGKLLSFLSSASLREKVGTLLAQVRSKGSSNIDLSRPILPFKPQGFRDFSLYMRHMHNASKATMKQNPSFLLQGLFMSLGRMLRLPWPRLGSNHAFREVPVHYHGNHLTMVTERALITWPCYTSKLDYELEVAIVLSRDVRNATLEEARKAIGGFLVLNDFSARDVQPYEMAETGFGFPKAKNFATGIGTDVVTADAILARIFFGQGLKAEVKVNGRVWSTGTTNDMSRMHSIEEVVAYASLGETLCMGEVLALGTLPMCCGQEINRWLQPGDEVSVSIEGIGQLFNTIGKPEPYPKDWTSREPTSFKYLSYRTLRRGVAFRPKRIEVSPLSIFLGLAYVLIAAWIWCGHLSPFDFKLWRHAPPLLELEGPVLGINHDLTEAERLFHGQIVGPESIAVGKDREIYLSLNDGRVVRTQSGFGSLTTVFFTGGVIRAEATQQYGGGDLANGTEALELMSWCTGEMQAMRFSTAAEQRCGRPLGIRFSERKQLLYIADAYHGIFTLHTRTLRVKHLVDPEAPARMSILAEKGAEHLDSSIGRPLQFTNDMDIMDNGDYVFSDSTWARSRAEHAIDILDGAARGRLFFYRARDKTIEPIMCGLHFANGIQFLGGSRRPSHVLVAESTRFRIQKVDLQAWSKASPKQRSAALQKCDTDAATPSWVSVFVEGLPGLPDNIRLESRPNAVGISSDDPVLLLGMGTKNTKPFSLLHYLYQGLFLRHLIGALIPLKYFHTFVPKYGLAGVISQEGEMLRLFQDPSGRTPFCSEVHVHPVTNDLLIGSFRNRFLGRVTLASA